MVPCASVVLFIPEVHICFGKAVLVWIPCWNFQAELGALGRFFLGAGSRSLPLELWAGASFTFLGFSEQSVVETPLKAAEGEHFQWLFPEQSCIFLFSINIYIYIVQIQEAKLCCSECLKLPTLETFLDKTTVKVTPCSSWVTLPGTELLLSLTFYF